jgi:two-component system LytT family response regulator
MELAAMLTARRIPVIFVSGHQEQAANAFDVEAIDFVIKPVERHRLRRALDRARTRLADDGARAPRTQYLQRLLVRDNERLLPVPLQTVDYFEALGNHVKVHHAGGCHTVRTPLRDLERRLDPRLFVRTHRSFIVNVARIFELRAVSHGDYTAHLSGGVVVPFSRAYRTELARLGYLEAR